MPDPESAFNSSPTSEGGPNLWKNWAARASKVLGFVVLLAVLLFFTVFQLTHGLGLLTEWLEAQKGQQFYVHLPFQGLGTARTAAGTLGLAALLYLVFRRQRNALGTGLVVVAFIVTMVGPNVLYITTPDYDLPLHASGGVARLMAKTLDSLSAWGNKAGHLPASDEEFKMAVIRPTEPSWYARAGERLPYQIVLVPGASGPYLQESVSLAPAVVYCAISFDLRRFWLTGTVLRPRHRTGSEASFLLNAPPPQGRPLVLEGTLGQATERTLPRS